MNRDRRRQATRMVGTVLGAALTCTATSAFGSDELPAGPGFNVIVYSNAPGGSAVLNGKPRKALQRIESGFAPRKTAPTAINECVALMMEGTADRAYLERATVVCDDAVALAEQNLQVKAARSFGLRARRRSEESAMLAAALSNRAVLRAMAGSESAARDDLSAAVTPR